MGANTQKNLLAVAVLFLLFYLLTQPASLADLTRSSLNSAEDGGNSLVTFVEVLTSHEEN